MTKEELISNDNWCINFGPITGEEFDMDAAEIYPKAEKRIELKIKFKD